jgi:hypothetical protein
VQGTVKVIVPSLGKSGVETEVMLELFLDIKSILTNIRNLNATMLADVIRGEEDGMRLLSGKTFLPGQKKLTISLRESEDQSTWSGTYEIHQPFLPSDHGVMSIRNY